MGIYYRATTVIGYRVSTDNCYETIEKPNCTHNPPTDVNFCPKCGKKVGTHPLNFMKSQFIDDFREEFINHLPKGYVFEQLYDGDGEQFWFGYGSNTDDDPVCLDPKPYEGIKAEIITLLEPFTSTGLFVLDDAEFGIWTIYAGS